MISTEFLFSVPRFSSSGYVSSSALILSLFRCFRYLKVLIGRKLFEKPPLSANCTSLHLSLLSNTIFSQQRSLSSRTVTATATHLALRLVAKLLRQLLQRSRVRAGQVLGLFAVLEEEEGGDAADAELEGQVGDVVGVEARKGVLVVAVVAGVLVEEGGDGLAGAAPGGVGLEGDVGLGLDELVELGLGGDVDDFGHFGCWGFELRSLLGVLFGKQMPFGDADVDVFEGKGGFVWMDAFMRIFFSSGEEENGW
jgi:hypothetical protein